jgi:hypothetical protein
VRGRRLNSSKKRQRARADFEKVEGKQRHSLKELARGGEYCVVDSKDFSLSGRADVNFCAGGREGEATSIKILPGFFMTECFAS